MNDFIPLEDLNKEIKKQERKKKWDKITNFKPDLDSKKFTDKSISALKRLGLVCKALYKQSLKLSDNQWIAVAILIVWLFNPKMWQILIAAAAVAFMGKKKKGKKKETKSK